MTENEVKLLGFKKESDATDESRPYHYYTYDVCKGLHFITNASDDISEDNGWYIEFFDTEVPIRYHKFEEAQALLNSLERHVKK